MKYFTKFLIDTETNPYEDDDFDEDYWSDDVPFEDLGYTEPDDEEWDLPSDA